MNWRRGSFRAWLLLAVIWCGLIAVYAWSDFNTTNMQMTMATNEPGCDDPKFIPLSCERQIDVATHGSLWAYVIWAMTPPLILLIFGAALGWAVSGFRKQE
jgi:hypothetical protein